MGALLSFVLAVPQFFQIRMDVEIQRWWVPLVIQSLLAVGAFLLLLIVARRLLGAPAALMGFEVLGAASSLVVVLVSTLLSALTQGPQRVLVSLVAMGAGLVGRILPNVLVLLLAAVVLGALWVLEAERTRSSEDEADLDEAGVWPAARRRFGRFTGLGRDAEPLGRRLALWFAAVGFAIGVLGIVLRLPLSIAQRLLLPSPGPGVASFERISLVLNIVALAVTFLVVFAVIFVAVRRFGAPHSIWLPTAATALLEPLAEALVLVRVVGRAPLVTIVPAFALTLVVALLRALVAAAAVALATRARPAAAPPDAASSVES